jgi:hypothetical protein
MEALSAGSALTGLRMIAEGFKWLWRCLGMQSGFGAWLRRPTQLSLSGLASVHNGQPPRLILTQRCRTLKTRKVRSDPVLGAAYYWIFSDVKAAKDCDIPSL